MMRNILILLGLLVGPLAAAAGLKQFLGMEPLPLDTAGRLGLVLLFGFTAIGHFFQTQAMSEMLPPWVPGRVAVIYGTGVLELLGAAGLLFPDSRRAAGVGLLGLLVVVLPANVYSAVERIPVGGHALGPAYLVVRVPVQLLFLGWTWWFGVRQP